MRYKMVVLILGYALLCTGSPLLKLTEKMFDVNFGVTKSNKTSSSLKRRE